MAGQDLSEHAGKSRLAFFKAAEARFTLLSKRWSFLLNRTGEVRQEAQSLRETESEFIQHGNKTPQALVFLELDIISQVPVVDVTVNPPKPHTATRRSQLIEQAKAGSAEWLKAQVRIRQVVAKLETLSDQEDLYRQEMRGLEYHMDMIRASLDFFRR